MDEKQPTPEEQRRNIEKALKQIRAGLRMLIRMNAFVPLLKELGPDEFHFLSLKITDILNVTFAKTAETGNRAKSQR